MSDKLLNSLSLWERVRERQPTKLKFVGHQPPRFSR
jgi:hypothetical protein